jgi:hypothetical protein
VKLSKDEIQKELTVVADKGLEGAFVFPTRQAPPLEPYGARWKGPSNILPPPPTPEALKKISDAAHAATPCISGIHLKRALAQERWRLGRELTAAEVAEIRKRKS